MSDKDSIARTDIRSKDSDSWNGKRSGIDFLRDLVESMSYCREDFLERYSVEQLIAIREAWMASKWDLYPDQWTDAQVKAAIAGWVPNWDEREKPIRSTVRILRRKES